MLPAAWQPSREPLPSRAAAAGGGSSQASQRRQVAGARLTLSLRKALDELPDCPGVYRLIGRDGTVVYVGKARSLQRRVSSYLAPSTDGRRLAAAIRREVASVEHRASGARRLVDPVFVDEPSRRPDPHYSVLPELCGDVVEWVARSNPHGPHLGHPVELDRGLVAQQ